MDALIRLDGNCLLWIQDNLRQDFWTPFWTGITSLGDKGWFWIALALLLAAVLTAGILAGCASSASSGSERRLGSFQAVTLDGGTFTQADIAGKDVTIINFWGTFCAPCIAEMPDLAAFEKALPDNVRLITICVDAQGNEETAKMLLDQAGYEGVTLTGGNDAFYQLMNDVQAVPTTIFVGPDGEPAGQEIIGMQPDLEGAYLSAINKALADSGKAEISLEK